MRILLLLLVAYVACYCSRHACRSAKLSLVRDLQRWGGRRRHKLRFHKISRMHGNRARPRQPLPAKYAIPAATRAASTEDARALSILSGLLGGLRVNCPTTTKLCERGPFCDICGQHSRSRLSWLRCAFSCARAMPIKPATPDGVPSRTRLIVCNGIVNTIPARNAPLPLPALAATAR